MNRSWCNLDISRENSFRFNVVYLRKSNFAWVTTILVKSIDFSLHSMSDDIGCVVEMRLKSIWVWLIALNSPAICHELYKGLSRWTMTVHCFEMMLQNEGSHSILDGWMESIVYWWSFFSISFSALSARSVWRRRTFSLIIYQRQVFILFMLLWHIIL